MIRIRSITLVVLVAMIGASAFAGVAAAAHDPKDATHDDPALDDPNVGVMPGDNVAVVPGDDVGVMPGDNVQIPEDRFLKAKKAFLENVPKGDALRAKQIIFG